MYTGNRLLFFMKKLRVLMVGYEAAPFFKRGGLGDVLGSLPKALGEIDVDARVVIPYYAEARKKHEAVKVGTFSVCFGSRIERIGIYRSYFPNTRVAIYLLENKKYLSVINTRGRNKKIDQFAFFDLCAAHFVIWCLAERKWPVDIIHCNDWHTGLIPLILHKELKVEIPTLLTIHNLSYQGKGSIRVLDLLHVQDKDAKELKRGTPATEINILGEGIIHAASVSTVSPTYAREIVQNNDHDPIHTFLLKRQKERGRKDKVLGILNGIDYDLWDPNIDNILTARFGANWLEGKRKNKEHLLGVYGLSDNVTFCFIGRMARQKGIDVVLKRIQEIIPLGINILFLGTGEKPIEASIMRAMKQYPKNIKAEFVYNEQLAHRFYAGADFILIPSHFEPCGLIQMIAMRYGTLPIASKTGGLQDTIDDGKNGFLFKNGSSQALLKTIERAMKVYKNTHMYEKMVNTAMKTDFSWKYSALQYKALYTRIVREHMYT